MNNREIDAKIAVISSKDATRLGIKKQEENLVTIDGQIVEVEWVDEFGEDWHLPNIVLKAQTYLKTLRNVDEKKYVNVYSNKYENFERIVNFDVIEGTTLNKVREFLVSNEYGPESAIDEFNYGLTTVTNKDDVNQVLTKINENITIYKEEYEASKNKLAEIDYEYENFEISDDEYIEERSDALASLQILSLSIYRDLVLLNSFTKKVANPELIASTNSIEELATKLDTLVQQATATTTSPTTKVSKLESPDQVKTWTVDMRDPWYVNIVEWTPEEFASITRYESNKKVSQPVETKTVIETSQWTKKPDVKVWTVELKQEQPVEQEKPDYDKCDAMNMESIVETKTNATTLVVDDNNVNEPVSFEVEMQDPVYYYADEWTVKNSFGGNENKTGSKQAKSKGFFKDLNIFKKKKNKKDQDSESQLPPTDDYYLVTDVNGNENRIQANNPMFKGIIEWEPSEFDKDYVEKFANFEIIDKNYAQLMDKTGTLVNQQKRVVTEEEKLLDKQIHDIQNEIDELETQLNDIKNK